MGRGNANQETTDGTMQYRVLGQAACSVSELCLGTMMFGGPTDEAQSRRIIDHALEDGVNFIDTANVYTEGRSEAVIGPAIKAEARPLGAGHQGGAVDGPQASPTAASRAATSCRPSRPACKRLQTDHIDLYYIHRVDPDTAWEQTIATFGDLIREGKIREWGTLQRARLAHPARRITCAAQLGVPQPTALQPYYNLMNRQPEIELLPAGQGVRPGRRALQPDRARRADRQVQGQPEGRSRQPRRPPGPRACWNRSGAPRA